MIASSSLRRHLSLLLLLISPHTQANDEVLHLISERLSLMQAVAAHKWINRLQIADLEREETVIQAAVLTGLKHRITKESSTAFYRAQIEAAKDIQRCWFNRWQSGHEPSEAADLHTVIRPRLLELGARIAAGLLEPTWDVKSFRSTVEVECLSENSRQSIFKGLQAIERYESRYNQIIEGGVLRVGTTGDYAPFSFSGDSTKFSGIDIDLSRDLADSLDVTVVYIHTTWPSLSKDFSAGEFDIAMSGVSITDKRKVIASFSLPYHVGGKTPIALCSRTSDFDSLEKIDRKGIRIVVNPGGTNERYLDTNIVQATKVLHTDNRNIFDQIVAGRVDLMITDAIEVRLQTARNKKLCATMPGKTLTLQKKGIMLPKDGQLLIAVNQWLKKRIEDGTVAKVFTTHLNR